MSLPLGYPHLFISSIFLTYDNSCTFPKFLQLHIESSRGKQGQHPPGPLCLSPSTLSLLFTFSIITFYFLSLFFFCCIFTFIGQFSFWIILFFNMPSRFTSESKNATKMYALLSVYKNWIINNIWELSLINTETAVAKVQYLLVV